MRAECGCYIDCKTGKAYARCAIHSGKQRIAPPVARGSARSYSTRRYGHATGFQLERDGRVGRHTLRDSP